MDYVKVYLKIIMKRQILGIENIIFPTDNQYKFEGHNHLKLELTYGAIS
jgi:hypothetical protein